MKSPTLPILDNTIGDKWYQYFIANDRLTSTITNSGITSNRPIANLWIGQQYFDTTLNKPVYSKSVNPNVWVDAMGTVV